MVQSVYADIDPLRSDLLDSSIPKFLLVGECGHGKSSLINALVGSQIAAAGRNGRGVTKELKMYKTTAGYLIDTPGIGDMDVKIPQLIALIEAYLTTFDVNGVIICSKDYSRIALGGQLVSRFVNLAFKSDAKWDCVAFVWTHGDKADAAEVADVPKLVEVCLNDIGVTSVPNTCVTRCPSGSACDVSGLITLMNTIAKRSGIGKYSAPSASDMAQAIGDVTGSDVGTVQKELAEVRNQLEEQKKKHEQEMEELRLKHERDMHDLRNPPVTQVPLIRYWNGKEHFYTTNAHEIGTDVNGVTGNHGYKCEGVACHVSASQSAGSVPLYRYWNGTEHFYTTSAEEIGTTTHGLKGRCGYTSEGVAGYVWPNDGNGRRPLYRYWNGIDHFYTCNVHEIGTCVPGVKGHHDYTSEGVQCYVI